MSETTREKENTKDKGGRPSLVNVSEVDKKAIEIIAAEGYTDKQLAEMLCVTEQTINNYKIKYPEFFEALKRGKDIADAKVEIALFQRALGYSHPDVHISNNKGEISITPIIKHYPPDPTSMIFWLKNRQKDRWRDKQEIETTNKTIAIGIDFSKITMDDIATLSNLLNKIPQKQEIEKKENA